MFSVLNYYIFSIVHLPFIIIIITTSIEVDILVRILALEQTLIDLRWLLLDLAIVCLLLFLILGRCLV